MTRAAPKPLTGRKVLMIALGGFGAVIAANAALTVAAVQTFSGLVVPNSYVASQGFDRARAAQEALGWTIGLEHDGAALRLTLADAAGRAVRPAKLAVTLGRPTTGRDDRTLALQATPTGYAAAVALAPGNWRVEIAAVAADGTAFRQRRGLYVPPAR